jgi:hypothetical protein
MSLPPELYIYYRVSGSARDAAFAEVTALHDRLRQRWPGLQACLLGRAHDGSPTDPVDPTWMEIFRQPGGWDEAALADVIAAGSALPSQRLGPRIVERFVPMAAAPDRFS